MATAMTGGHVFQRAIVSALVLLLLVLLTVSPGPASRHASGAGLAVAAAGYCAPHGHDEAPPPAGADHAPCCPFCAAGRDGPPLPPEDMGAAAVVTRAPPLRLAAVRDDGRRDGPIGWASSWSSRAPPLG